MIVVAKCTFLRHVTSGFSRSSALETKQVINCIAAAKEDTHTHISKDGTAEFKLDGNGGGDLASQVLIVDHREKNKKKKKKKKDVLVYCTT